MDKIRYFSLDEAREEIKRRWDDEELKKKVSVFLDNKFLFPITSGPKSVNVRSIISPDRGYDFFIMRSSYLNLEPVFLEYTADKFVLLNEEKKGLARICLKKDSAFYKVDIVNLQGEQGKLIKDVLLLDNETSLVDYHHRLFELSEFPSIKGDVNDYFKSFGGPEEYYLYYLTNFVCHGVLFENFIEEINTKEIEFTKKVIFPAMKKIYDLFGVYPIIIKMYPDNQDEKEDLYWWSYCEKINVSMLEYVESKKLNLISYE